MTTPEILSRLENAAGKKASAISPRDWMVRCPAHKDGNPSLKVTEASDGKTLFKCFAGCFTENICAGIGIKVQDLFLEKPLPPRDVAKASAERERLKEAALTSRKVLQEKFKSWPRAREHKYLLDKKVQPTGDVRICQDSTYSGWLVIPMFDAKGEIQSAQYIAEDGTKKFASGLETKGAMFPVLFSDGNVICIVEGYATGLSVAAATGWTTFCAFTCGNLLAVAQAVRKEAPEKLIIIAGDNDESTQGNPGRTKAEEAAKVVENCIAVVPNFPRR